DALVVAHEAHVVHRDLKPENIMVTRQRKPKVLDFGLAKRTEAWDGQEPTLTIPGTIMGTIAYMSPEQVRGQEPDWRTDIFSLGSVLYEMAAGRRAFQAASAAETMSAILNNHPAFDASVSPQLQTVLMRCLEKKPERRFQSVGDLAASLRSLTLD